MASNPVLDAALARQARNMTRGAPRQAAKLNKATAPVAPRLPPVQPFEFIDTLPDDCIPCVIEKDGKPYKTVVYWETNGVLKYTLVHDCDDFGAQRDGKPYTVRLLGDGMPKEYEELRELFTCIIDYI